MVDSIIPHLLNTVLAWVPNELLLSLQGVNQARNSRAEVIRVAGCAVIGQGMVLIGERVVR